jgi:protein transport protein SEC31
MRNRSIAWHPDQATQLVVASEDDHYPLIQVRSTLLILMKKLWDLRSAQAPLRELSGHSRGILSLDWCARDAGMLLTASKVRFVRVPHGAG